MHISLVFNVFSRIFDFPKERYLSLGVSIYEFNKIQVQSPMALLEYPHPSLSNPSSRRQTQIPHAVFEPTLSPIIASPPEPMSVLFRHLGSRLAVVELHRTPLSVAEPL